MPTGVALRDARAHLFAAADRVLLRDGATGLTSRAVTEEAGVAKGVLHRHFVDFDDFLAELIRDHISHLEQEALRLEEVVGQSTVVSNLAGAFGCILTPVALKMFGLIISRDGLRARLRETTPHGIPIVTEAAAVLSSYLAAERRIGRLLPQADTDTLAFTLIGTGHLLFAGELGALPTADSVKEAVASIIVDVEPGARLSEVPIQGGSAPAQK